MADDRTSSEEPYIADLVVHDEHNSLPRQPRKRQRQAPKEEAAELVEQFDPAAAPTAAAPAGPAPPGASRRGGHRGAASDGVPEPVGDAAEQEEVRELLRVWDAMDQPARNKYHRRRMRWVSERIVATGRPSPTAKLLAGHLFKRTTLTLTISQLVAALVELFDTLDQWSAVVKQFNQRGKRHGDMRYGDHQ